MRNTPRIGLIGCGAIGHWHGRILAQTGGIVLAGVCDSDGERAKALAALCGCPAYTDAADFLASAELDGVIIASPESLHLAHAELAAAQGCAMLIEKPVASDVATVQAIKALAEGANLPVLAGHVERFEAGTAQLVSALRDRVVGATVSIMARRQFSPGDLSRFAGHSSTLRVLGVHDFDLVRWLHPAAIDSVYAAAARGPLHARYGLDDHVVTSIRFTDGAVAMVESAWNLPESFGNFASPSTWQPAGNNRLEVFGSTGVLSNDMSIRSQQLVALDDAGGFRAAGLRHQPVVHGRVGGALRGEVEHFIDCVLGVATPIATIDDGLRALALTAAAEASLLSGQPEKPVA